MSVLIESFHDLYSAALRGEECLVVTPAGTVPLPVTDWNRSVDRSDRAVLAHCLGPTLDVGCGPGRMTAHLTGSGRPALGIDIVREAVLQARARGSAALVRDVFDRVPGEGRWSTVLLADGNVGIGGDPHRLLARAVQLLGAGGRVVVDLAPPGSGIEAGQLRLRSARAQTAPFAWATVAADRIGVVCAGVGLRVAEVREYEERWFAVLVREAA